MDYQAAIEYIFSFINYEKLGMPVLSAAHFNLARIEFLLARLGKPQLKYPSIVIAGTKGKGSTGALCATALEAGGYRVGFYSQPHLHDYRERMRINGKLIEEETLAALVTQMQPAIEETLAEAEKFGRLTYYEVGTGLALLFFAEAKVDMAVLEIGLGGRLDAVNVVTPLVSVITSISYDHMDVLGDTLTKIAGEKAGIIKPGVPVVSAPQDPEALAVIEATCRDRGAPLYLAEAAESLPPTEELSAARRYRTGQQFKLAGLPGVFETPLLGEHQLVNTAVAARALELQAKNEHGLKLGPEQIRQGFRQVSWPGRLEVVENKPEQALLVVDGAHNAESAQRLAQALNRENFYYEEIVFIVGVFQDKDVEGIFRELRESHLPVKAFILTKSESPRALAVADLKRRAGFEGDNTARVVLAEHVSEALKTARELSGPLDLICATGSLSITAEVQKNSR